MSRIMHESICVSQLYDFNSRFAVSAFSKLLEWLNNHYILPEVYITDNDYADIGKIANNGEIVNVNRIIYFLQHISKVMKAMQKGINICSCLI